MEYNTALIAAGGLVLAAVSAAAFFFVGRRKGAASELARQRAAKDTADEAAQRIIAEAGREAETLRKSAVVAGKEELISLREDWEAEAKKRREEIEREEKRVQDRGTVLER